MVTSAIQTNTQVGKIIIPSATDLTASIGCFAVINTAAQAALPLAGGLALYVIDDSQTSTGVFNVALEPLTPHKNIRVIAGGGITVADKVTTNAAGKAITATSGNNILAIAEETAVTGQYVLLRPLGGIQTA